MPATRTIDVEPVFAPPPEATQRLARLRWLAWLLDRSIPLPGGRRIGLDPILGLAPGAGDWIGSMLGLWLVYEALRLGLPLAVIARMVGNLALEAVVGAVPVLGDLFDFAWQANHRNVRLVEARYDARLRPRSFQRVALGFASLAGLFLTALGLLLYFTVRLALAFLQWLF